MGIFRVDMKNINEQTENEYVFMVGMVDSLSRPDYIRDEGKRA
jgi:osmotically-inducible protein OsmY